MLQRAFKIFSHGDETVDAQDMSKILKRMGQNVTDQELQTFIKDSDKDKSGKISFPEL